MSEYKDEQNGISRKIDFNLINDFFQMFKNLDEETVKKNDELVTASLSLIRSKLKSNKELHAKQWAVDNLTKSFDGLDVPEETKLKIKNDLVEYAIPYERFYSFKVSKAYVLEVEGVKTLNVDVETIGTVSCLF